MGGGFIIYNQLQVGECGEQEASSCIDLSREIKELAEICTGMHWVTEDPLGIGGLLCNALQVAQMMVSKKFEHGSLLLDLPDSSLTGLEFYLKKGTMQ